MIFEIPIKFNIKYTFIMKYDLNLILLKNITNLRVLPLPIPLLESNKKQI